MTDSTQRRRVCPVMMARLRLRPEDFVAAAPAAILPPAWEVAGPDAFTSSDYTAVGMCFPSRASIQRTGPRTADEAQITIPWSALPIDARTIRAAGVEVFADAVETDRLRAWLDGGRVPISPSRENLRFIGTVDAWSRKTRGGAVELRARDFTGLLLDARLYPSIARTLDLRESIVRVCQTLVNSSAATVGMVVEWGDTGDAPPAVPSGAAAPSSRRLKTGAIVYDPDDDLSLWDAITDMTVSAGLVASVELDRVVIRQARTVYGGTRRLRFVERVNVGPPTYTRDLGRRSLSAVEVRCWDTENRRRLIARWPEDAETTSEDEIVTVRGVTSEARLLEVARGVYLERRRNLLGVSFETRAISSLDAEDAAMLSVASGDVVDLQPTLAVRELGDVSQLSASDVTARLAAAGVDAETAAAIGEASERRLLSTFWVKSATHDYDTRTGYRLRVSASEIPVADAPSDGSSRVTFARRSAP